MTIDFEAINGKFCKPTFVKTIKNMFSPNNDQKSQSTCVRSCVPLHKDALLKYRIG